MVKLIPKGSEDCLFNNSDNVKIVMKYTGLAERVVWLFQRASWATVTDWHQRAVRTTIPERFRP